MMRPQENKLFGWALECLKLGSLSFGASARSAILLRVVVEERRWVNKDEAQELFTLAQAFPGPNFVNLSLLFGYRLAGFSGALLGLLCLSLPGLGLLLGLASLVDFQNPLVRKFFSGASLASFGLFAVMMTKMLSGLRTPTGHFRRWVVLFLVFGAAAFAHLRIEWCLLGGFLISVAFEFLLPSKKEPTS